MNRLLRISATLFLTSTILVLMVNERLKRAKEALEAAGNESNSLGEMAKNEITMSYVGMGIAGVLILVGLVMMIKFIKQQKEQKALNGD
jgi:uncharacterized membrane protein